MGGGAMQVQWCLWWRWLAKKWVRGGYRWAKQNTQQGREGDTYEEREKGVSK